MAAAISGAVERGAARFLSDFEPGPVARVVLDHPTREQTYDYIVPPELSSQVAAGSLVWVPSRSRRTKGWVVGFSSESEGDLKEIVSAAAPYPVLSRAQLRLAAAAAEYYLTDMRRILRRMTPPSIPRNPPGAVDDSSHDPVSSDRILELLAEALGQEGYQILSSGPLAGREAEAVPDGVLVVRHPPGLPPARSLGRSLRSLAESGVSSLVALGSMLTRDARLVREAVGKRGLVIDTAAPARRRASLWSEACKPPSIVVGDRAVVLHRSARLGLVCVVDEASPNHREDRIPYYNARTLSLLRARIERCPVVLTAPWPSYESRQAGTLFLSLPSPWRGQAWPVVDVVDRSKEVPEPGVISSYSAKRIRAVLESGGRVVLFVSKKGGYRSKRCADCWFVLEGRDSESCSRCGSRRLKPASPGASAVESEARRLFPGASLAQLTKESSEFDASSSIIVATEAALWRLAGADMVVVLSLESLVGLVSFDAWFRSARVICDLAGLVTKPGHSSKRGVLLIQTYNASHPVISSLVSGDESRLLEPDLEAREADWLPPFSRAVLVEAGDAGGKELVDEFAEAAAGLCTSARLVVAGPHDEAGQRRALVFHDGSVSLWEIANTIRRSAESRDVKVRIEVDPDASYRQL